MDARVQEAESMISTKKEESSDKETVSTSSAAHDVPSATREVLETVFCNQVSRTALPVIGSVLGRIGGAVGLAAAGTAMAGPPGTAVGAYTGGAVGAAAGSGSVSAALSTYCDGEFDTKGVLISTAAGLAGGAGGMLASGTASSVAQATVNVTGSRVTGAIMQGMVEGVANASANNATSQTLKMGSGTRESFDIQEFATTTAIGGVTGGLMGGITNARGDHLAQTKDQLEALRQRFPRVDEEMSLGELRHQAMTATKERSLILDQLANATGRNRSALEERLADADVLIEAADMNIERIGNGLFRRR